MPPLSSRYSTALVTGASGGLGQAFVEMLLSEGVAVWGTARDKSRLETLSRYNHFTPVSLDLANGQDLEATYQNVLAATTGGFDLVINNAGFGVFGRFDQTPVENWTAQIETNLIGSMRLAHLAIRSMIVRNRGCLVNVSSVAVDHPLPFMSGYNVTKAGLSALSESLIFETRGLPVTVLDFRPGDYQTKFNQAMHVDSTAFEPATDSRLPRAWQTLEANLKAAPKPDRAARDLRKALIKGRSGTVYSGDFFQVVLAPLFSRLAPSRMRRAIVARYFGAK